MSVERRTDRAAMRVSGPEAERLLHDVLTAPIAAKPGPARWWALLSPQGKIQAEGLISFNQDAFWLDVPVQTMDAFFRRMRMYKLRADVTLEDLRDSHEVGWSPDRVDTGIVDADDRAPGMGYRVIAPKEQCAGWTNGMSYIAARIGAGVTEIDGDIAADSQFPHDLGMDLLGGIDFKKGCYVGQEVVSRMQHRGTARKRPVIVAGNDIATGDSVTLGGREVGRLGHVVGGRGVAIVRLDKIAAPQEAEVRGVPVTLALPEWATYGFGPAKGTESSEASPA